MSKSSFERTTVGNTQGKDYLTIGSPKL